MSIRVPNLSPELLYVPKKQVVKPVTKKDLGFHSVLVKTIESHNAVSHPGVISHPQSTIMFTNESVYQR